MGAWGHMVHLGLGWVGGIMDERTALPSVKQNHYVLDLESLLLERPDSLEHAQPCTRTRTRTRTWLRREIARLGENNRNRQMSDEGQRGIAGDGETGRR